MKLSQLSHALPAGVARTGARLPAGPRRVSPAAGLEADPNYALQELLNAVQELAQGPFQGEGQVQQAASALAAELERLGPEADRLLRDPSRFRHFLPPELDLEA